MFCLQCLDRALVWKFLSLFLDRTLERFEEEMKFDIMLMELQPRRVNLDGKEKRRDQQIALMTD